MENDIGKIIDDIILLVDKKEQLDQIIFDVSNIGDEIGYKSVVDKNGDDPAERKELVKNAVSKIKSELMKDYFNKYINESNILIFEPNRFKNFQDQLQAEIKKIICIRLTIAVELKKEDTKKISTKLSEKMEQKVLIDITVDKSIVGGAIIHKDNYIFDFSVKSKLGRLADEWKLAIEEANSDA